MAFCGEDGAVRLREQLDGVFRSQARLPDVLYCVAGGTSTELGFITDIDVGDLESCMRNNYFTAAYAAQSILKMWTEDDAQTAQTSSPKLRQIVFINSAAAFLGMPGYVAYTCKFFVAAPAKKNVVNQKRGSIVKTC